MNQRTLYLSRTHLFIIAIMLLLLVATIAIYWQGADIQVLALNQVEGFGNFGNFWAG